VFLSITPSASLIFVLKLVFRNKLLKDWLSAWNNAAKIFMWILDLCVLHLETTANPRKLLIALYNPMMDLIIVDTAICFIWVFLTALKEPPMNIVSTFTQRFALPDSGFIRMDQGGKLA
jgi:hypothetical protein